RLAPFYSCRRPPIPLENGLLREIEPLEYRHRLRLLRHLPAGHVFGVVGKSSSCSHDDTIKRLGRYNAVIIETVAARVSPHERSHYLIAETAFALLLLTVPLEPPRYQLPAGGRCIRPLPAPSIRVGVGAVSVPRVRLFDRFGVELITELCNRDNFHGHVLLTGIHLIRAGRIWFTVH